MSPVLYRETEAGRHRRQGRQVQKEIQYGIILRSGLAKPASFFTRRRSSRHRRAQTGRVRGPVRAPSPPGRAARAAWSAPADGARYFRPARDFTPHAGSAARGFPRTVCLYAGASGAPVFPACIRALPRRPFRPPLQTAFSRAADPRLGRIRIPFGAFGRLHIGPPPMQAGAPSRSIPRPGGYRAGPAGFTETSVIRACGRDWRLKWTYFYSILI